MGPAGGLGDRPRTTVPRIEPVEAGIGIGLEDSCIAAQMTLGMLAGPIARIEEHRRGRITAPERLVVAHVEPAPAKAGVHNRPLRVWYLACTGTVVSSPWIRLAAKTWA